MNNDTHKRLLENDEIGRYETPKKFNYRELTNNVNNLKTQLENEFNAAFKLDNRIQDASFHYDLAIPEKLISNPEKNLAYSIRVSNFGNMITIFREDDVKPEYITNLKQLISESGFHYISPTDLDELYDGTFEEFKSINTDGPISWSVRYFDYL